ncbi:MAG: hypothetical protein NTX03_08735 [Bacteroidetes bacterium]|nr:hypothetical protein [Bacteroidota bacterium]
MKELKAYLQTKIAESNQLIISLADDENSIETTLYCVERNPKTNEWKSTFLPISAMIGKKGLAWDFSLAKYLPQEETFIYKREGDGKAPAGIFTLLKVFGKPEFLTPNIKLPTLPTSPDLICVDDVLSVHYNEIISREDFAIPQWKSAEEMYREDKLYDLGLIVDYNFSAPKAGLGSCIFMHVWRSQTQGTEGCTAMAKKDISKIIRWADAKKNPALIQLPKGVFKGMRLGII